MIEALAGGRSLVVSLAMGQPYLWLMYIIFLLEYLVLLVKNNDNLV